MLGVAAVAFSAATATSQTVLSRYVLASGAAASQGSNVLMVGTIGQPIIGRGTNSAHVGYLGFWYTMPRGSGTTAVRDENDGGQISTGVAAMRVAPNPVRTWADVHLMLPVPTRVSLKLYDGLGREVRTVLDEHRQAGMTTVRIDASDLESGNYNLMLITGGTRKSTTMTVVK